MNRYWGRLTEELPGFQFHLVENGEPIARARSIPIRWDGTVADLPAGIDGAIERGFEETDANALCAMLIAVSGAAQGRGLSRIALEGMAAIARENGFDELVAPVRPSWKDRYPLAAIDRYARWAREDGLPLDPWLRVHVRVGGELLLPEPRSLRITGTVAEWESWTAMAFPETGDYIFPHGLATVAVDREADLGRYWEPNVWVRHRIDLSA